MSVSMEAYSDNSIQWALGKLGSTDYPFLCLGFVEDCLERANGINLDGYSDARQAADGYRARDDGRVPPRGAWVFYDCWGAIGGTHQNWGHVGISLGDGRVIHAWDTVRIDGYLDIQRLAPAPGWTQPVYIGWAEVEEIVKKLKPVGER